jgi:hypothetical protein
LDICLQGALITRPAGWNGRLGERYALTLQLADAETTITMDAHVAHIEPDRIGLACEHLDLDSAAHLKRLVQLNLGSDTLLSRELAELLAVHKQSGE